MLNLFKFSDEVSDAKKNKKPIVTFESTVIAHGLSYPHNFETALELENITRKNGVVPAHIALINGQVCIGLNREQLLLLANPKSMVKKIASKDIGHALNQKILGATTVSAAIRLSYMADIYVFSTGGIGGVHRDAHESLDISSDLYELAKTKVLVISAGVKSILDIKKTLEKLESLSVPVIGYQTEEFPEFYSRGSGCRLNLTVDSPSSVAQIMHLHFHFADSGILLANPIPLDYAISKNQMEEWISKALIETKELNGPAVTPKMLEKIHKLSQGKTLEANVALLKNNALLASKVAKAYQNILFS
jgi:pseudouridine-5'-phosphate glycosidase